MDTLTPPPSFRALRVRTRTRANSYSFVAQADENKCPQCEAQVQMPSAKNADESLRSHASLLEKRFVESQSRGRSRQRLPRLGLKVDVPSMRPRQLSLVIPQSASCCSSSVSSQNKAQSPTHEEELMFTMSPVQTQSPASLFLNNFNSDINAGNARSIHELVATKSVAEQTSEKVLSALWTPSRGGPDRRLTRDASCKRVRSKGCVRTIKPRRSQLYISEAWTHREPTYSAGSTTIATSASTMDESYTVQDSLPSPRSPRSPEEPFMYSFPIFNSSPLVQARLHRARRAAGKFGGCGGGAQVPSGNHHHHPAASAVVVDAIAKPPSAGPIRARNLLRIQSGEGLFSEDEHAHGERDGMIISGAFRSGSLEEDEKGGVSVGYDDEDFVSAGEMEMEGMSVSTGSESWTSSVSMSASASRSPLAEKAESFRESYRTHVERLSAAAVATNTTTMEHATDNDRAPNSRVRRHGPRRSCPPIVTSTTITTSSSVHPTVARAAATEEEVESAMLARGRARFPAKEFGRFASQGRVARGGVVSRLLRLLGINQKA